jgi:hypothetical protein
MERDTQQRGYTKMQQVCLEGCEEDHERGNSCYTVTGL